MSIDSPTAGMPSADAAPTLTRRAALAFTAYQAGERDRMSELVDLLTPVLWHTARGQRLDGATAEDVVQTAWIRLVEHADAIQDPQAVLGWLVTTVRREAWRLLRQSGRAVPTDEVPDEAPSATSGRFGPADGSTVDPALVAVLHEGQRQLWHHVTSLPQRCQALLRVIAFVDRPDYAALSEALGMPVGSIGPTRGRCLAKLRAALLADPTWSAS